MGTGSMGQPSPLGGLGVQYAACGTGAVDLWLLADELVRLDVVAAIPYETVAANLEANSLKPWLSEQWCIPKPAATSSGTWKTCSTSTSDRRILSDRLSVWTRPVGSLGHDVLASGGGARPRGASRPRVRAGRGGQLLLVTAPLRGWRHVRVSQQRTARLRPVHQGSGRCPLSPCRADRPGHGPTQHPLPASLYDAFPAAEAKRLADRVGDPLHAPAWQLAEYGRDRAECAPAAMARPSSRELGDTGAGGGGMGRREERDGDEHRLALHHPRCPHQAQALYPVIQA